MFGLELWFLSLVHHKASKLILKNPFNYKQSMSLFSVCVSVSGAIKGIHIRNFKGF